MSRKLQEENVPAAYFKMPTVQESLSYNTDAFIKALSAFKLQDDKAKDAKVIVACLPSYNHLKKAIFELKKSEALAQLFDIKFVLTKVSAKNFYMNKNRNPYQYLVENCMKGVSNAIIMEKQNLPQSEIDIMYSTLKNANFARNVILTPGRTFNIDDLAKVICYQNEKFSILYNKYFYGFEKEGRSAYYLDNAVQGAYFNFRYPLSEEVVSSHLTRALQLPLFKETIDREVRQIAQSRIEQDEEDKENEQKKINEMDESHRKRYLRAQKRKQQIEEDLRPEMLLLQEMAITKKRVLNEAPTFERVRGYIQLEDEFPEGEGKEVKKHDTDYQLNLRFNELSVRTLKNKDNRLEPGQLGLLIYGRCLADKDGEIHPMIKETLKCARTRLPEKKAMRARGSVTEAEIATLEDKYCGLDLPTDGGAEWEFTGFCYQNMHSADNERMFQHPNREFLITRHLQEVNAEIDEHNCGVQKEWKTDLEKYE